jgi:hypothetical protein
MSARKSKDAATHTTGRANRSLHGSASAPVAVPAASADDAALELALFDKTFGPTWAAARVLLKAVLALPMSCEDAAAAVVEKAD